MLRFSWVCGMASEKILSIWLKSPRSIVRIRSVGAGVGISQASPEKPMMGMEMTESVSGKDPDRPGALEGHQYPPVSVKIVALNVWHTTANDVRAQEAVVVREIVAV